MNNMRVNLLSFTLVLFFTVNCHAKHSDIHYAIKHGNLDEVTELITKEKSLLFTKDDYFAGTQYEVLNRSLLHLAIYYSEHEILNYLLEMFTSHNIDINKLFDSKGRTPLFYAVDQADPDALKLLIKFKMFAGAMVGIAGHLGNSVLSGFASEYARSIVSDCNKLCKTYLDKDIQLASCSIN